MPASNARKARRAAAARLERIQTAAGERQTAWVETEQPERTDRLTIELKDLYAEQRIDHAGNPGAPFRRPTPEMRRETDRAREVKKGGPTRRHRAHKVETTWVDVADPHEEQGE